MMQNSPPGEAIEVSLSDSDVQRMLLEMDRGGYAILNGAIAQHDIALTKNFVEQELERRGGEYFSFVGTESVQDTLLYRLGLSSGFRRLLAQLSSSIMGRTVEAEAPYQVLRVVSGLTGRKQSLRFHYDASAVTALVPIAIPKDPSGPCGDLILYPHLRSIRSSVVFNIFEKIVMQNGLVQKLMATDTCRRLLKAKILRMEPGNIYIFKGYQTLHGNGECLPDSLRATAIYHMADPHGHSKLTQLIRNVRSRHEARKERALKC